MYFSCMVFKIKPSTSGAGSLKAQVSIAVAPYLVKFKDGRQLFYSGLREIYKPLDQSTVASVYDRHARAFLDTTTLWQSHRRKFVSV
jgi:hypothetical protein